MPALEVLTVSIPEELPEGLRAARIRSPEAGASSDGFTLEVAGLVITDGGRARTVELLCQGMIVRELPVTFPRKGLAGLYPGAPDTLECGFRGAVGALQLPTEFELELVVVRDDGRRFNLGSIRGRRARPQASFEPTLRALMVTSMGRTGTVWLMRMLASHPGIVIQPHHTYEMWPAQYWAHMLKVLSSPADHERSVTSRSFEHDLWHVGQNPFYLQAGPVRGELAAWLAGGHVNKLASFCLSNVEDWYRIAARAQSKEPTYFAEKNFVFGPIQNLDVADLYPDTRELFSVRDLRDVACSLLSFFRDRWTERGYDNERALDEIIVPWARNLVASWRARGEQARLVRYEDLVLEPAGTVRGVLDHLGLDCSDEMVDRLLAAGSDPSKFSSHGTSATLAKTLGRWAREGDEAFRDKLNELFHDGLIEFGYTEAAAERVQEGR